MESVEGNFSIVPAVGNRSTTEVPDKGSLRYYRNYIVTTSKLLDTASPHTNLWR